jgi:hypothetical protein
MLPVQRLILLALAAFATIEAAHAQAPTRMRVGMNINWITPDQVDGKFSDQMIAPLPWSGGDLKPGTPIPAGAARNARIAAYPGVHTLKAAGKGTLSAYIPGGVKDAGNLVKTTTPNLYTATFTGTESYTFTPVIGPQNRVGITVQATDAAAPINSVQVLAPGAGKDLYHPSYLAGLAPFAVIRTMDAQQTAGSKEVRWADRNTQYGHDLEALIALGNQADRDLWICIPHGAVSANGAPTDWCYGLGDLLNACCSQNRTIYLEYSDEVWNFGSAWYPETAWAYYQQARAEYEALGGRQIYARLAHKAFQAVTSRIGPYGPKIKRVFAGQLVNTGTIDPALPWAVEQGYRFDALAGGMYWGMAGDTAAIKAAWAAGDQAGALKLVDDGYRAGVSAMMKSVDAFAVYAKKYGMELVAYEGGQGGSPLWYDPAGRPIMLAYTRSPLCVRTHVDALTQMDAAGTDLMMYYSYCHVDALWGARQGATDCLNGRYRGLLRWLQGAPPAQYLGPDATTKGNWVGTYGALGAMVAGAPAPAAPARAVAPIGPATIPAVAKVFTQQAAGTTTDPRAPQTPDGSARAAGWWYGPSLDLDVPAAEDGVPRILSLYCLEWVAGWNDAFTATLVDADSGTVLDSRPVAAYDPGGAPSSFTTGVYLRWAVEGHVTLQLRATKGSAKFSGLFLDPVPTP